MPANSFTALFAEGNSSAYSVSFKELTNDALPAGDVLVEISYSSLNYKDGLAVTGRGKIIRKFPMVLGIDFAGQVLESASSEFRKGDQVVAVGHGFSETRWGGYAQRQRVPAETLVQVPKGLTLKQTMAIGSAGFTSMLCLIALEHQGIQPGGKEIIVTGAAGGVGSTAVALFAAKGYKVAASTGRPELHSFLRELGASTIVDRAELAQKSAPLASERWAGGLDTVGGQTLASVLAGTASYGAIAACGLAGGAELSTTVFPFILRNVALLGINSTLTPNALSLEAWQRLAHELPLDKLDALTTTEPLSAIHQLADKILAGKTRGRIVIDVNA
ncbi:MAG: MDR family oxidoreductase [Candidatus Acidiferrales bacterium]